MKKLSLFLIMALCGFSLSAQGVLNVRINDVLLCNDNDIVDDYGERQSWIEVFNTGYERVNIGGCYLGIRYADRFDAQGNKLIKKYYIPRNNPNTSIEPQGYRLFFCESNDEKGTFYTNFTLEDEPVDMIILYNANGKDVISVFKFPAGYQPQSDVAWGILGNAEIESKIFPTFSRRERKQMTEDQYLDAVAAGLLYQPQPMQKNTPATTNEIGEVVPRHEVFRQHDPVGGVMAVTAMGVVFLALVAIFLVFKVFGKIMIGQTNRTEAKHKGEPAPVATKDTSYSGEEVAAIAMALRLYSEDLHVKESTVITINHVSRMYSPWSSKIHGITSLPEKKNR